MEAKSVGNGDIVPVASRYVVFCVTDWSQWPCSLEFTLSTQAGRSSQSRAWVLLLPENTMPESPGCEGELDFPIGRKDPLNIKIPCKLYTLVFQF